MGVPTGFVPCGWSRHGDYPTFSFEGAVGESGGERLLSVKPVTAMSGEGSL